MQQLISLKSDSLSYLYFVLSFFNPGLHRLKQPGVSRLKDLLYLISEADLSCLPRSLIISLTMYLSIPRLCSGWRNERNSSSFSSWSAGGLSAWNQRSFRLSKTSWAVDKNARVYCKMFLKIQVKRYTLLYQRHLSVYLHITVKLFDGPLLHFTYFPHPL